MFARIFGMDYRTMALFRIAIGLTALANIVNLFPHIAALYSDHGVMTRAAAVDWMAPERWSILLISGLPSVQVLIFIGAGLVALLYIFGYRTRLMAVLLWVFAVSLSNRNLLVQQGGDILIPLLLFWGMFLPLGARFSVDAALAREAPRQDPQVFTENRTLTPATFAILLQASYVYWVGALLKTGTEWIPDGTAVYYAMHLDSFAMPITYWFRQFDDILHGLTYYVWTLELLMPVIVFSPIWHVPVRLTGQFLLITMHIGFIVFLGIGLFPAASIASLLLYTPSEFWDWLEKKLAGTRRAGVSLYYDRDCGFCYKTCLILREFCLPASASISRVQDDPETKPLFEDQFTWVVRDHDGTLHTQWQAVNLVLRRSIVFAPVGWLLDLGPLRKLGARLYHWIGENRGLMGRLTDKLLPYRALGMRPTRLAAGFVVAATAFVFYLNILTLDKVTYQAPRVAMSVAYFLKLDQRWNMFAPRPAITDGWIVVPATLEDGTRLDLFTGEYGEPDFAKPDNVYFHFGDYRWRKYFNRLPRAEYAEPLKDYARYLCRSWNIFDTPKVRLKSFEVIYMQETTLPNYGGDQTVRRRLLSWRCFE